MEIDDPPVEEMPCHDPAVEAEYKFDQWVDYLPHNVVVHKEEGKSVDLMKRVSLDVTESHLTDDSSSHIMDTEHWPDSASLEDYAMVPNVLLVENDPRLQHELLLTDPSVVNTAAPDFFHSLQEVLEERRRVLMASMEASQRTRRCLEPHIKQRASLACVLSDIEGSSKTLREHVLVHENGVVDPMLQAHAEFQEDEEMLASAALDGLADEEDSSTAV